MTDSPCQSFYLHPNMQFTHLTDLSEMETSIHVSPGLPFYALDFVLQTPTSAAAPTTAVPARKRDILTSVRDSKQQALQSGQTRYVDYDLVMITHNLRARKLWSFVNWFLRTYKVLSLVTGVEDLVRIRSPKFFFRKRAFAAKLADNLHSVRWWVEGDETGGIAETVVLEVWKMLQN